MTCERVRDLLSSYLDGGLDAAERSSLEGHLGACPDCARLLDLMRDASAAWAAFPEAEPSPALRTRLAAIGEAKPRRFRLDLRVLARPALQPVLAAASALLVVFSFYLISPDKGRINREVSQGFHRGVSTIERLYAKAGAVTGSLGAYAENVLDSLKRANPLGKGED